MFTQSLTSLSSCSRFRLSPTLRHRRNPPFVRHEGPFHGEGSLFWHWSYSAARVSGVMGACFMRRKNSGMTISACQESLSNSNGLRKRKVVEHLCLLKAKDNLTDEEEKDMLDYLYTTQYQMGGIVAISLGRITDQNTERYTHAVFMRFQRKGDLLRFYENPFYLGVLEKHVMPYCHGLINVDYESEVDDDILPIFRKGEEFNYGVEFVLLVAFKDDVVDELAEDVLISLHRMAADSPSLVVQVTQGSNFHSSKKEYTHGVVIRFHSLEALEIFVGSTDYKSMWTKFEPVIQKMLCLSYPIDPVGKELM